MDVPKIVTLDSPLTFAGVEKRVTKKNLYLAIPKLVEKYSALKNKYALDAMTTPWEYVALAYNHKGTLDFDYALGNVINESLPVHKKFARVTIPAGEYACLEIHGTDIKSFMNTMSERKAALYKEWLPQSDYDFSGFEYEYQSEAMAAESSYWTRVYVGLLPKSRSYEDDETYAASLRK